MGRRRWSDRLTVEECDCLDATQLRRTGLFDAGSGASVTAQLSGRTGKEAQLQIWLKAGLNGPPSLFFCQTVADSSQRVYIMELAVSRCNFGGLRYWFVCPLNVDGVPCRRRARVLYLPPGRPSFGCRACYNLTYDSAQRHDNRVNTLAGLGPA